VASQNFVTRPGLQFVQRGTGALERTVEDKLQDSINVLDFIPSVEHASIRAGTSTYDATSSFQAAIAATNGRSLFVPAGIYTTTGTLFLNETLHIYGEQSASGAFAAFTSKITFNPPSAVSSTLASNINDVVTTIPVTDASSFPSSGIIYFSGVNGEYVKYTGKSGNNLTGCSRGYWGGTGATSGVTPSNQGESQTAGASITLLRPAFMRDGVWTGSIKNLYINHADFVSADVGWTGLGLCIYANYAAYGTTLQDTCIYGFEKAAYFGRAYVTNLRHPMLASCAYGIQLDSPNGSVITETDSGEIGSATIPLIGWVYYLKGGNGCSIFGGNFGNGNYNTPIVADSCRAVQVTGMYAEAHKVELCLAKNTSVIYMNGVYSKESTFRLGRIESNGEIYIENLWHEFTTNINGIYNTDDTGKWAIKNSYNGGTGTQDYDSYGIGIKTYRVPNFSQANSPILLAPQRGVKSLPDNVSTPLLKLKSLANASNQDIAVGLTVDYFVEGVYSGGGAVSEKGILQLGMHHRWTLAPETNLTKVGATQITVTGTTRTVTFSLSTASLGGGRYETTLNVVSVASSGAASVISFTVTPSNLNLTSDTDDGFLTIL
jgi:hypothetical protein